MGNLSSIRLKNHKKESHKGSQEKVVSKADTARFLMRRLVNMDRHIMLGHLNKLHIIKEIA